MALPSTIWRPDPEIGEMGSSGQNYLVTQDGDFLVDQDGNFLVAGLGTFTELPATIWDLGSIPTGALQSEDSDYILTEGDNYIETEYSVTTEGGLPDTIWRPPFEGEMSTGGDGFLVDQSGNFIVDESGNFLVTGVGTVDQLATTVWEQDDGM